MKIHFKLLLVLLLVLPMVIPSMVAAEGDSTPVLKDISKHWAKSAIERAVKKGYVTGYPDGTFRPDEPVTVAEFLSMMLRSMTVKDEGGRTIYSPTLMDQIPDHQRRWFSEYPNLEVGKPWYSNVMDEAIELDIIRNYEVAKRHNEKLTREEAARFIRSINSYLFGPIVDNYAKVALTQIKDYTSISMYLDRDVAAVSIAGIMNGYTDGTWKPKRFITRAETISVMERLNHANLRTPMKVDLSRVPYLMIPLDGYPDQIYVFPNNEMKKIYDQLGKDAVHYTGVGEKLGSTIMYYTDMKMRDTYHYEQNYFDRLNDFSKHYFDMGISFNANTYGLNISGEEGRFDRAKEPLKAFLQMVFAKSSDDVYKLIADSLAKHKNGVKVDVDKVIERRQVVIFGGRNMIGIEISAYADK